MSVLCADRMVATVSSSGLVKSSSQYTCGNACASVAIHPAGPADQAEAGLGVPLPREARRAGLAAAGLSAEVSPTVTDASVLRGSTADTDRCGPVTIRDPAETFGVFTSPLCRGCSLRLIPGLLMLATFGLRAPRIEPRPRHRLGHRRGRVSRASRGRRRQHAGARRHGPRRWTACISGCTNGTRRSTAEPRPVDDGRVCQSRCTSHHRSNPEFQPTRHANRV